MSFIDVGDWTPEQVAEWLRGLDDCVLPYTNFFVNNYIDGCKLLTLTPDILENLNVKKIGHQEIILEGVDLLKVLHYELMNDTLVQQSLRVGCRSRSLFNQLKSDEINNPSDRVSCTTLAGVSGIMEQVKQLVSWIDRYPFSGQPIYMPIRRTILQLSIELVLTAQRDQFVEKPNIIIKNACHSLSNLCDRVVQDLHDSLSIVPAYLEVVAMKKRQSEQYLGIQMNSTYNGIHMIVRVQDNSPSSRCGRIEEGDEIIQIRHQTVVGWTMNKVVRAMNDSPQGIVITFKKRPTHPSAPMPVPMLQVDDPKKLMEKRAGRSNNHLRGSHRNSGRSLTLGRHPIQQQPLPKVPQALSSNQAQASSSQLMASCRTVPTNGQYANNATAASKVSGTSVSRVLDYQEERVVQSKRERAASTTSYGRSPLVHNSATTDQEDEDDEEACFESNYKKTQLKGPVTRADQESLYGMKPRSRRVQRRNTISGMSLDSPTSLTSPIRIEDLIPATSVSRNQLLTGVHPHFDRRLSHDAMIHGKETSSPNNGLLSGKGSPASSTVSAPPVVSSLQDNHHVSVKTIESSSSSSSHVTCKPAMITPQVPYAKVMPLERTSKAGCETMTDSTIPKQVIPSSQQRNMPTYQLRQSQEARRAVTSSDQLQRAQLHEVVKPEDVIVHAAASINWVYSHPNRQHETANCGQNVGVVIPSNHSDHRSAQIVSCKLKSPGEGSPKSVTSSPGQMHENRLNEEVKEIPPPLPLRTSSILTDLSPPPLPLHPSPSAHKASRATACKSLGVSDFEGWLFQRRQQPGFLVPSSKWVKRWVVLKKSFLYCFKTKESRKASSLIHLPGFVVAPATESKKYTFKLYTLTTAFHFSSETVAEMSKWISKIGFAAITYSGMSKTIDDPYFSESDDDGDFDDLEDKDHKKLEEKHSRESSNVSTSSSSSKGSKGMIQGKLRPPTPPKPLPRVSKQVKSSPPVKSRSPGADSGISDTHEVTPKSTVVTVKTGHPCHDDMVVLDSPLIAYNHVVPKEFSSRMAVAVDATIFDKQSCQAKKSPISILDQEYNRLFGAKNGPNSLQRPLTPETSPSSSRKPMTGLSATMKKRRAFSSVSSDRTSIETALHHSSSSVHSGKSSSCYSSIGKPGQEYHRNSPDTEEEWGHIVKTMERVGLPTPERVVHRRVSSASQTSSKSNETTSMMTERKPRRLLRSLSSLSSFSRRRRQQVSQEVKSGEFKDSSLQDLLKEPITMQQLQSWLQKNAHNQS